MCCNCRRRLPPTSRRTWPRVRSRRIDYLYQRLDGRTIDIGLSVAGLPLPDGSRGYIYTFQDVTDVKRFEHNARLQQRLAAVGEMAAGIAHEIRNPLASMSGSMQMLKQELPLSTDQAQLMDIVLKESERLNQTIKSFLAYARPQRFSPQKLDLRPLVHETAMLLRNSTDSEETHRIEVEQSDEPVMIDADEGQIRQIIWNLATNGLRAMPDGGTLRLSAVREMAGSDLAVLRVEDEGVGIPPEEVDTIFQPFRGSFGKGTGLGLAIVHRIVTDYDGHIEVEPAIGPRHHLPRLVPDLGSQAGGAPGVMKRPAGSSREGHGGEKPRILIADDEQSMREWMRLLFQRDGFEVFTAEDGVVARDLVAREYVDVVLTDIRMPKLDGVGLLASIRQSTPDVIVTMMTAHWTRDSADWTEAQGKGAEALFEKPFRDVNLVTMQVRQLLESRRLRHENTVLRQTTAQQGFAGIIGKQRGDARRLPARRNGVPHQQHRACCPANRGPARSSSRARFTTSRCADRERSWPSTAAPCPKPSSSRSCSATCVARSPAPTRTRRA